MIGWIAEFFGSLPPWYWVAGYTAIPVAAIGILVAGWKAAWKMDNPLPLFVAFILACFGASVGFETAAKANGHSDWLIGKSIFVGLGFSLIAYGIDRLAVRAVRNLMSSAKRTWAWMNGKQAARKVRQNRDPKRIVARCRVLLAHAQRGREQHADPTADDTNAMVGFGLAGENFLTILSQLFEVVEYIDACFRLQANADAMRKRVDDIYPEVPLGQFAYLFGTTSIDSKDFKKIREGVQGMIEEMVLFFEQLPMKVGTENVYRKMRRIPGLQQEMAELVPLPPTTPSMGTIADFETGRLQAQVLEKLAAVATRPMVTVPHQVSTEAQSVRSKVRA